MATESNYAEAVAAAVRTAMEHAGSNSNAIAVATGIPRVTLLRRLTGNSPFTVLELSLVAEYLNIPVEQLSSPAKVA